MEFLKKLFGIHSDNYKEQEIHLENSENKKTVVEDSKKQSPISLKEIQDNLVLEIENMNYLEKERMIDMFAKESVSEEPISDLDPNDRDDLFEDAARLIVQEQQGSTSLIQRKLKLGYNRAGRLIDQLEAAGIIGSFEGKARDVLFSNLNDLENYLIKYPSLKVKKELFYEKYKEEIEKRKKEYYKNLELENDRLEREAIKQKIVNNERRKRLHKEALQELIEEGEIFNFFTNKEGKREFIPQDVMDKVWNRDGGKCVRCESQENLEFDHIIPYSKGGATSYRNLQLLCKKCNIEKSNKIG